ncbi:hypothetical protein JOS77_03170 [Chromobacterium haemolyticum]|nr:hypothetical protein JOS77_03170 [Chromobacterium haemolyticum]
MRLLIDDVVDLLRFRVKPLDEYQYPRWQTLLFLIALGLVASADTAELGNNLTGRMLFMVLFTLAETLCFASFIGLWLRFAKWDGHGSLFGLVAVASGLQFIETADQLVAGRRGAGGQRGAVHLRHPGAGQRAGRGVRHSSAAGGVGRIVVRAGGHGTAGRGFVAGFCGGLGGFACRRGRHSARSRGLGACNRHLNLKDGLEKQQDMPWHVLFCMARCVQAV